MPKTKTQSNDLYAAHPGVAMTQKWILTLPQKTGRSLDEWVQLIQTSGPTNGKEQKEWLKKEFGLGSRTAWWLTEQAAGKNFIWEETSAYLEKAHEYVEAQYAGAKAHLRPLYDELLAIGKALGPDVRVSPGKTIVPLYRKHVFAQIKAPNRTRVDLSLALKNVTTPERLIDTGGFAKGDRLTHRFAINSLDEIDAEVRQWFKMAYDLAM